MISMIQNNILWSPLQIGGLTTKNRFAVLPMECADATEGGHLSQDMQMRYDRYAEGGAGLVFLEAVTLQHETRSRDRQLLLDVYKKESREEWERFVASFKAKHPSTLLIFQYHHAGETAGKEFSRRVTVKPLTPFGGELIDAWYIDDYIHRQVETAKFLYRIGVDGIDLKFCHGYLGSQLLRPYNDRDWKYGGSWENRSRFAFETCERIRRAVPDPKFLIGARVSMYEEMRITAGENSMSVIGAGRSKSRSPSLAISRLLGTRRYGRIERGSNSVFSGLYLIFCSASFSLKHRFAILGWRPAGQAKSSHILH